VKCEIERKICFKKERKKAFLSSWMSSEDYNISTPVHREGGLNDNKHHKNNDV